MIYASQSTMIYWCEVSPGKFIQRLKEPVTKDSFKGHASALCIHKTKKTKSK